MQRWNTELRDCCGLVVKPEECKLAVASGYLAGIDTHLAVGPLNLLLYSTCRPHCDTQKLDRLS